MQPTVLGPYTIHERIGVGGMATVHRAVERGIEGLERVVALKRLLPHLTFDESTVRAFVREARLAALLQHANIAQTFALGRVGTTYFIAMEHIEGCSVRQVLEYANAAGPPPIPITLAIVRQVCDALDYAHSRSSVEGRSLGLVHRDVSPTNLLVTLTGHVKVIDFGIAQSIEMRTHTGRIKGKLAYMAPEAMVGMPLDQRSDLFSLGVVFHELLTARSLFGTNLELTGERVPVLPPSAVRAEIPHELDEIVLRALATAPEDRWQSAAELRAALHELEGAVATPHQIAAWCKPAFEHDRDTGEVAIDAPPEKLEELADTVPRRPPTAAVILDDVPDYAEFSVNPTTMLGVAPYVDKGEASKPNVIPTSVPVAAPPPRIAPPVMRAPEPAPWRVDPRIVIAGVLIGIVVGVIVLVSSSRKPDVAPPPPPPVTSAPTATTGHVTVEVTPTDAEITIAKLAPHAAPWTVELAPGSYPLTVRAPNYEVWTTTVVVTAGQGQLVRAALSASAQAPAVANAALSLDSVPPGLDVILDGMPLHNKTPIRTGIAPGPHTISVQKAGVEIWSTTFVAKENKTHRFTAAAPGPRPAPDDAGAEETAP